MGVSPNHPSIQQAMRQGQIVVHNKTNSLVLGLTEPPPADEDEEPFRQRLRELARGCGWECYHTHDSRKSDEGFPDEVLVRERVIFAELKSRLGRSRPAQKKWAKLLKDAGAEYYLWRPGDWEEIRRVLELKR